MFTPDLLQKFKSFLEDPLVYHSYGNGHSPSEELRGHLIEICDNLGHINTMCAFDILGKASDELETAMQDIEKLLSIPKQKGKQMTWLGQIGDVLHRQGSPVICMHTSTSIKRDVDSKDLFVTFKDKRECLKVLDIEEFQCQFDGMNVFIKTSGLKYKDYDYVNSSVYVID